MAEETTTASSSTTQTEAPAATEPQDSSTSTTSQEQAPAEGGTLLTGGEPKAEEQTTETKTEEPAPNPLFGAPEGDYEVAGLPEGTEIDKAALDAAVPLAKELGLSNEGFSKLVQTYAKDILPGVVERVTSGIERDVGATHAQWANEATELVKTDPLFANKPLSEVQQLSAKAIDRYGGTEFRSFLDQTGLGNHPAMLRFAFAAGSAISEDTTFERGGTPPREKSLTDKFYPQAGS